MLGEAGFDVLDLQRLGEVADDLHGLRPRHLDPLESLVGLDDPPHLGLDRRQVIVGDRPRGSHVVIEALAHSGAEGEFHVLKEPRHRPGHDVGRGMPHHGQRPGVAGVERFELDRAVGRQRRVEAHRLAVEHRGDRPEGRFFSGCDGCDGVQGIGHAVSRGRVVDGAIGKADVEHGGGVREGWLGRKGEKNGAYPRRHGSDKRSMVVSGSAPLRRLTRSDSRARLWWLVSRAISSVG